MELFEAKLAQETAHNKEKRILGAISLVVDFKGMIHNPGSGIGRFVGKVSDIRQEMCCTIMRQVDNP